MNMKISEFYIGQELNLALGQMGSSILKVVAIDSPGYRLKLKYDTGKEVVLNKDEIEYIMMGKFEE